jgi:hypothetical protein
MRQDDLEHLGERLVVGPTTDIEPGSSAKAPFISSRAITNIVVRLLEGKRVRRSVPGWGRLHIDRQLPFLIVYRRPTAKKDAGTARLVMGEASYLTATGDRRLHPSLVSLIKAISTNIGGMFGAFLIIEIWAGSDEGIEGNHEDFRPGFQIITSRTDAVTSTVQVLEKSLKNITTKRQTAEVGIVSTSKIHPLDLPPRKNQRICAFSIWGSKLSQFIEAQTVKSFH